MNSLLTGLTAQALRKAADLQEKIEGLQRELEAVLGGGGSVAGNAVNRTTRAGGKLSAQGLANIRAGVAKRMAAKAAGKRKQGKMSAAAKANLSRKLKARWAKRKAAGKLSL